MKLNASSMGFALMNNVEVTVIDKETGHIKKTFTTHNKATRNMVKGLLYFIEGYFTATDLRDTPLYGNDVSKTFIPCYFGCGDGGVDITTNPETGWEMPEPINIETPQYPKLLDSWTETVDYLSENLVREFTYRDEYYVTQNCRKKIDKQEDTLYDTLSDDYTKSEYKSEETGSSLSMDSLYFHCVIEPDVLNKKYGGVNVYVTELGLFAGKEKDKNDLLAYVKLNNIEDDNGNITGSNVLYVTPRDTIIVNWVITIAAIGKDNVLSASIKNENNELIVNDIEQIPEGHYIEVEEYPTNTNGGN